MISRNDAKSIFWINVCGLANVFKRRPGSRKRCRQRVNQELCFAPIEVGPDNSDCGYDWTVGDISRYHQDVYLVLQQIVNERFFEIRKAASRLDARGRGMEVGNVR